MATAQTMLQTEMPRVTYDAANGKIILDEEKWMLEWAKFRECRSVQRWLEELMSTERATFVKMKDFKIAFGPKGETFEAVSDNDPHHSHLSEGTKAEIRRLRKNGESVAALSKRFHCGGSSVRRAIERHGKELDASEIQLILHLRQCEYVRAKELASRFGVTETTVLEIFAEYDSREHVKTPVERDPGDVPEPRER